jgi:hydroxypyruvate isomerase
MPRFAANLSFLFNEVPFLERFGEAAHAGFRAVEFAFAYEYRIDELVAQQREHRLDVVLINAPPGDWNAGDRGLASLPGREHEFAASIAHALQYARALGCPRIHVMAGVLPSGADASERERRLRTYVRNLRYACSEAAAHAVTILIEPINQRDRPNTYLSRVEHAAEVIAKVDRPNIKMQYDFYHVQITQGDVIRRFEMHQKLIGHVQIAAVPSRHEPDLGELNFPVIFEALDGLGYTGWIACEYRPRGRTEDGLAWGKPYGLMSGRA